jgi:Cu+-exporting ATPase
VTPKHFQVAHRLSRRLRLVARALLRQTERGYLLEILLRKHAAVKDVRVVADIGSVTLHYDPANWRAACWPSSMP